MNWEAIGAIGEIIGAIAVFLSLIYLALQIRSNTNVEKAAALREVLDGYVDRNNVLLYQSPELTDMWANGLCSYEDQSITDKRRFMQMIAGTCLHFQNVMQMHEKGLVSKVDHDAWLRYTASLLRTPGGTSTWPLVESTITPTVREHLNNHLREFPDAPSFIELNPLFDNGKVTL